MYHNYINSCNSDIIMKFSSFTLGRAIDDVERLRVSGEIQYKEGYIGRCKKYFLVFPNDKHKYYYNPNKLISDSLKKKVFNYLYSPYTNMSKRLNQKTTIKDTDNDDNIRKIQKWIKKNSPNFKQENHQIQVVYDVTSENTDGKVTTEEFNTKSFDVFGGKIKIRKAIQAKTDEIEMLFKEQYAIELQDIKIKRIYIY